MKFRTEIERIALHKPIGYSSRIVTLGSCFAENISRILLSRKFCVTPQPTGILFNPASIERSLRLMHTRHRITAEELIEADGRWLSYDFHSSISGNNIEEATRNMQQATYTGNEALSDATHLIITLGTAWVYRRRDNGVIVANCHKQPATLFSRELLDVEDICSSLRSIMEMFTGDVIVTISPVRHIGDGLVDNSLSKALLRVAVERIKSEYPTRISYFPSYEILIDDLRDYRFYGDDLVHPSSQAIEYIGEKFFEVATTPACQQLMQRIERIVVASNHRPMNPRSEQYRDFCQKQLQAIASIEGVDLSKEKEFFEHMLQINL